MNKTAISWATHTWNPVSGCTKVSPGCANCYAEGIMLRFKRSGPFLPGNDTVTCHPDRLGQPMRKRAASIIFVCSMSDLFHEDVPIEFLAEVFAVMAVESRHQFLVLTKRPDRMKAVLTNPPWRWPLPNVWLGVSAENQHWADWRIPLLLDVDAAIHYVSAEPLLRPMGLNRWMVCQVCGKDKEDHRAPIFIRTFSDPPTDHRFIGIDWLIVGGESGPKARPMHPEAPALLAIQAAEHGIPLWFKQWGTWAPWGDRGKPIIVAANGRVRTHKVLDVRDHVMARTRKGGPQEELMGAKHQEWPPYQRAML